jgi:predicted CoA-substrate-specific enzyme activase
LINKTYLGIDVGSTTVKIVVLDKDRNLLAWRYLRSRGQPRKILLNEIEAISEEVDLKHIAAVGLTGSGGGPVAKLIGGHHVNELIAQTRSIGEYYPHARTVIEIGGQDSKFLSVEWDDKTGKMVLADMAMNNLCAAGTGSFLDQQAERLGISIEEDFARLAVQSEQPARIAGRCTVFAKSDMIHLQQKGTPQTDIIAGLAMALARNFKSVIGKAKAFTPPILFQGGVAYNQGVVRAFESVLKLKPGELIIPEYHHLMPALGTALIAYDEKMEGNLPPFNGFAPLQDYVRSHKNTQKTMPILPTAGIQFATLENAATASQKDPLQPVYLGVDVGSITTKVVLIDEHAQVVARRYWHTEGKPLEVVRHALFEVGQEVGHRVKVIGVGVTGSGRYLTADFVGGDVVRSEITAQARAAIAINPTVDTIFEIGGQDSKFISINNGAVVNFAMNNACAAGTGSFLEEQAEKLEIKVTQDFSEQAFCSQCPSALGDRCTVFMESDLVHHQQQGAKVNDLTAGLAYAIAENYLNRVVENRKIGKHIFFQGGVAWNNSVVSAFSELTKRQITVPPHHDVTGAIGAALLAMEEIKSQAVPTTKFKGFDLREQHYEAQTSICQACSNLCEVNKVIIGKEAPIFYGARCDIFEEKGRGQKNQKTIPDFFAERQQLLMGNYTPPPDKPNGRLRVGFPRSLIFYDLFPYWRSFFETLDIDIVLSEMTNPRIAKLTKEHAVAETCYPAKLVYGHVVDLLEKKVDAVFLPSVFNRENIAPGQTQNSYCPYIPAMSHVVTAAIDIAAAGAKPIKFPLHMLWEKRKTQDLRKLAEELGVSDKAINKAEAAGLAAQQAFYAQLARCGQEALENLDGKTEVAVVVGRPYTLNDFGLCQNLPYKLRKMGVIPLPMDYLPLKTVDISDKYNNMFWRSGQDILAAATLVRNNPRLQAIYLTSFNCGPDSFILSFFRNIMADKPFLELELDDHTADAGIITRCEAFFESLRMGKTTRLDISKDKIQQELGISKDKSTNVSSTFQ